MAKATLMVFILDQLPGFSDVLNMTFDVLSRSHPDIFISHPQYCDPTLAEPILGVVNQQFLKTDPNYKNVITTINHDVDMSAYNEGLDEINHVRNLKEMEISKSKKANRQALLDLADVSFKDKIKNISNFIKNMNIHPTILPERLHNEGLEEFSVPYLVAIFETLSNITAQTCGGILMAPYWVLTSASCLSMLKDSNIEGIKANDSSSYSTVVGAKNPMEDGMAYNVTDIFIYPNVTKIDHNLSDSCKKDYVSKVALMKIRPSNRNTKSAQEFKPLRVLEMVDKENITVVSWTTTNGSSSYDIRSSSVSGFVYNCSLESNISKWCLNVTQDISKQITVGGPLMVRRDTEAGLLAIMPSVEDAPYTVVPLYTYNTWITHVISHKKPFTL